MSAMHVNYEYVLDFIRANSGDRTKSLDYGCGAAEVVSAARSEGFDVSGADIFYEAGNSKGAVENLGLLGSAVKEIKDDRIDFPDGHFDLIVNNQVLEHVANLDVVVAEMNRVLKPGGKILSIFPSKEVWREGHCGIPLLHRFPRGSRPRVYYAFTLRSLGLGYHKRDKSRIGWARDFCAYLDEYTHYRPRREILNAFEDRGMAVKPCEFEYVLFRLGRRKPRLYPVLRSVADMAPIVRFVQALVRRMGAAVFVAEKGAHGRSGMGRAQGSGPAEDTA